MEPAIPSSHFICDRADMAGIVRRHAHDVRNHINCIDLEAALLEELVTDPDTLESVHRMRAQLTQLEASIQALSIKFADPQPITLSAADLLQLWKHQIQTMDDCWPRVQWSGPVVPKNLTIDPQAITSVLRELILRAAKRSVGTTLRATVRTTEATVTAELSEPAQEPLPTEDWVPELQRIVARNGGELERAPHPGEWITTLAFPVTAA